MERTPHCRTHRRRLGPTLASLAAFGLLAGCAAGPAPSRSAPGEITVALGTSPINLDYTRSSGGAIPQALLYNVLETLLKIDSDGSLQPLLAESYEVSTDRLDYTFRLRHGVRFSNGTPMTAESVKFSFDRLPTWTTAGAKQLAGIKETRVLAPDVVQLHLATPDNALPAALAGPAGTIFSPDGVAALATAPIGTGPYTVNGYDPGTALRLVANDGYRAGPPPMRRITLTYYSDPTAQTNALLTGGADVAIGITAPQLLAQFRGNPDFTVTSGTTNGEMTLSMNNAAAPFDDLRVRQAVRQAIDADAVREIAASGYGDPITTMVPPSDPWYEKRPDPYPYDPQRARDLLAAAGQPHPTVTFKVPNQQVYIRAAQAVQSYLQAVGFSVDLRILEFPAVWLGEVYTARNYQLAIINHIEPRDIVSFSNPAFYLGYRNPRADTVLAAARSGPPADYVSGMREYARIVTDDAAADFLYLTPWLGVAARGVAGQPQNAASESIDLTRITRR